MFTDIVDSSSIALGIGDASWTARLDEHDRTVYRIVEQFGGEIVKHTGDGTLALFAMASDAVKAALDLTKAIETLGISIRIGINAGEFERRGKDVNGSVVNLTARVMDEAAPGQILTTETITELMLGSRIMFIPTTEHTLKGFTRARTLYEPRRP